MASGKIVENNRLMSGSDEFPHHMRADVPGPAADENAHHLPFVRQEKMDSGFRRNDGKKWELRTLSKWRLHGQTL
jgi:hypothetical protein